MSVFGDLEALQYLSEIRSDTLAPESIMQTKESWATLGAILGLNKHLQCLKWMID